MILITLRFMTTFRMTERTIRMAGRIVRSLSSRPRRASFRERGTLSAVQRFPATVAARLTSLAGTAILGGTDPDWAMIGSLGRVVEGHTAQQPPLAPSG